MINKISKIYPWANTRNGVEEQARTAIQKSRKVLKIKSAGSEMARRTPFRKCGRGYRKCFKNGNGWVWTPNFGSRQPLEWCWGYWMLVSATTELLGEAIQLKWNPIQILYSIVKSDVTKIHPSPHTQLYPKLSQNIILWLMVYKDVPKQPQYTGLSGELIERGGGVMVIGVSSH